MIDPFRIIWLQSGGCGGCSMSLLNAESPALYETLELAGIELLWHPSLSAASGREFLDLLTRVDAGEQSLDALCIEGAVMRGPKGTGRFHMLAGSDRPAPTPAYPNQRSRCCPTAPPIPPCSRPAAVGSTGCGWKGPAFRSPAGCGSGAPSPSVT